MVGVRVRVSVMVRVSVGVETTWSVDCETKRAITERTSKSGSEYIKSIILIINSSIHPPLIAAIVPKIVPMIKAFNAVKAAIAIEVELP